MPGRRAVPDDVLETLIRLRDAGATPGFYLAGGTSLALRFGHRVSVDLHFFHPLRCDRELVLAKLQASSIPVRVDHQDDGTLRLAVGAAGTKVEFFRYAHPLVRGLEDWGGHPMASPLEVGLMKLNAISNRGSRKDFIDLYWINREATALAEILRAVPAKFAARMPDPYHLARSLGYFADAEREPPPALLAGPDWPEIRRWFADQADALLGAIEAGRSPW